MDGFSLCAYDWRMAVTYCTVAEVRANTNNPDLASSSVVSDDSLTAKIIAAETYIDSIAGYWDRSAGVSQARVFPRVEDDAIGTDIPDAVKFATIAQVEFMYENMPDRDHGIVQDDKPTRESISPRAMKLMSGGFIRKTGNITIPYPQNPQMIDIYGHNYDGMSMGDIHFQDQIP